MLRNVLLAASLFALLLAGCAAPPSANGPSSFANYEPARQQKNEPQYIQIGVRAGGLLVSDDAVETIYDGVLPRLGLNTRFRFPRTDHWSVGLGLEYMQADGTPIVIGPPIPATADLRIVSVPVTIGYNTASAQDYADGHVNLFLGVGFSVFFLNEEISSLVGSASTSETGFGAHVEGSADIPVGNSFYISPTIRYSGELFDSVGLADNVGGLFFGLDAGIRF